MSSMFQGVERAQLLRIVGDMPGWRSMGERMLGAAQALCPVSEGDDDGEAHLRDVLEVRFITGTDPRILLGTSKQGDKLDYVINGTDAHPIDPVFGDVLAFDVGGETVFARHVDHPGTDPNDFITDAIRAIGQESGP